MKLIALLTKDPNVSSQVIKDLVANTTKKIVGGVIVSNLNQLIAGGRAKKLQGLVVKMLKLKIIIGEMVD